MADKSKGNSRDKKGQEQKNKTGRDGVKDLPIRDRKADNVKGGAEPAGYTDRKRPQADWNE